MTAYNLLICLVVFIYYKVNNLPCAMKVFFKIDFFGIFEVFQRKENQEKNKILILINCHGTGCPVVKVKFSRQGASKSSSMNKLKHWLVGSKEYFVKMFGHNCILLIKEHDSALLALVSVAWCDFMIVFHIANRHRGT